MPSYNLTQTILKLSGGLLVVVYSWLFANIDMPILSLQVVSRYVANINMRVHKQSSSKFSTHVDHNGTYF